nr:MSHA biogenesis protein MshC [Shewanella avicenniae]
MAIISVVVLPRFFGASSYSAFALRQEIIAELRRDQMLAFNNPDRCFRLNVDTVGYQLTHLTADCSGVIFNEPQQGFPRGAALTLADGRGVFSIGFDHLGRTTIGCAGDCLRVVADETLAIAIESQGYIHEG